MKNDFIPLLQIPLSRIIWFSRIHCPPITHHLHNILFRHTYCLLSFKINDPVIPMMLVLLVMMKQCILPSLLLNQCHVLIAKKPLSVGKKFYRAKFRPIMDNSLPEKPLLPTFFENQPFVFHDISKISKVSHLDQSISKLPNYQIYLITPVTQLLNSPTQF